MSMTPYGNDRAQGLDQTEREMPRYDKNLPDSDDKDDAKDADRDDRAGGMSDDALIEAAEKFYRDHRTAHGDWTKKAREDFSFVAGKQWNTEDKSKLAEQLRPVVTFNRIQPVIDSVGGAEVQNRQEVRFIPRKPGDAAVNEIITNAAKWLRDECDAEDEESDAFLDCVICGMGWTESRLDYEEDAEGKFILERTDPLEMVWDAKARKRNLADARAVMRLRSISRDDAEAMWPDAEIGSDAAAWTSEFNSPGDEDGDIHDATLAPFYQTDQGDNSNNDEVVIAHYQWYDREPMWRIADPGTSQIREYDDKTYQKLSKRMLELGQPLKAVRQTKKVFRQAYICGNTVLHRGKTLCPTHFSFRCITGKRDHNAGTWYGLVRAMKDPQRWANKWLSQGMYILNANSKGGLMAERGAFENPREAEAQWADPATITFLNPGGLNRIKPKEPAEWPQGISELLQFGVGSIRDVTGVNLEMLGLAEKDQAGVVEYHRKKAALTVLAGFFDSLRRYRKEQGRILLYCIQTYLSDGRLIRIEGPEATQYVQLLKDEDTYKYDVVIDDAPSSPNQKEAVWGVLAQMLPDLLKLGLPIPPDILDYSPLPTALASRWKQMILQQQQNAAQHPDPQQAIAQSQMAIAQAQVESAKARAQGDMAKAQANMEQAKATGARAQADAMHAQVSAAHVGLEQQAAAADIEAKRAAAMANVAKAKATLAAIPTEQLEAIIRSLDTLHGVTVAERQHGLDTAQAQHDAAMDHRVQQHNEMASDQQHDLGLRQAETADKSAEQQHELGLRQARTAAAAAKMKGKAKP